MSEMSLLDWTDAYIKYKDSVQKKIKDIEVDKEKRIVKVLNKDGSKFTYVCTPQLDSINTDMLSMLKDEKIVCLNKKDNLNWLLNNWEKIKDKRCIFLFVNLKKSENWAINPHMHHSITDRSALKPGLKTLFESIPESD
jgi:hypothetical protein